MSVINASVEIEVYPIRPKPRTQAFVSKRPHQKSRDGCKRCKSKKIKCNEARPQCSFCQTRNIKCVYAHGNSLSTTRSHSPVIPAPRNETKTLDPLDPTMGNKFGLRTAPIPQFSQTALSSTDIHLMHHFVNFSSSTIFGTDRPGVDQIVFIKVPQLALQHEYMMHCVLGVAALHLRHLAPHVQEYKSLTVVHRYKALSGLSDAISVSSKADYQAILITSLFILVLAADRTNKLSEDELWISGWLGLWAGMKEMIRIITWEFLIRSDLGPIFARDEEPFFLENFPTYLHQMRQNLDPKDQNTAALDSTIICLAKLYDSLLFEGLKGRLLTKIVAWPANTVIAEFAALVKQRHPEALVLVAHYLVFTQLLETMWWMCGVSDREIVAIAAALPSEYLLLMEVPLQAAQLEDRQEIANLLLSQFPVVPLFDAGFVDPDFIICTH